MTLSKLIADDGLPKALSCALSDIGSDLTVGDFPEAKGAFAYAIVKSATRSSQVYIAEEERLYLIDFWRDGVQFGNGATNDIRDVAKIINRWVGEECSVTELEKMDAIQLKSQARAFDQGAEVEYRWQDYLDTLGDRHPRLVEIVNCAFQTPELRQLFPFISLFSLCFSRCTGYPYLTDTPSVCPLEDGKYQVFSANGEQIGTGSAKAAVKMLVDNLPPNCGPARRGTARTVDAT